MPKEQSITNEINKFYDKLWKKHEEGSLDSTEDGIVLNLLNAIDNVFGR